MPFKMVSKSDYAALPTKETNVMYIVTKTKQISSVEVNSKSLIDYTRVEFYDSDTNLTLLKASRGRPNEKLDLPIVEPVIIQNGTTLKKYMVVSHWSKIQPASPEDNKDYRVFPNEDTKFFAFRQLLKINGFCEVVIQGDSYQDQETTEKIKLTFKSSKVYLEEKQFNNITFVPILQYYYNTNENYISFQVINYDSSVQTSEEFEVPFKIYSDEKLTNLIGEFPLNIKVTISNESAGD